jgi:hypothetical protein
MSPGAPVISATRLRGGSAASCRGAASFATEAVRTVRAIGCSGIVVVWADSAFYSAAFTSAVRAAGAFFFRHRVDEPPRRRSGYWPGRMEADPVSPGDLG